MIHCIEASRAIIKISSTSCRNKSNEKTLPTSNDVEIVADDNTRPRKLANLVAGSGLKSVHKRKGLHNIVQSNRHESTGAHMVHAPKFHQFETSLTFLFKLPWWFYLNPNLYLLAKQKGMCTKRIYKETQHELTRRSSKQGNGAARGKQINKTKADDSSLLIDLPLILLASSHTAVTLEIKSNPIEI